jgi:hypothetical protein
MERGREGKGREGRRRDREKRGRCVSRTLSLSFSHSIKVTHVEKDQSFTEFCY